MPSSSELKRYYTTISCDAVNEQESEKGFSKPGYCKTGGKEKKQLNGLLSFVAGGSITIQQELVIGIGPAKCQIDQVLAGIVCC